MRKRSGSCDSGYGHCTLDISKDSSFVQTNRDCTYSFETQGHVSVKADTLILHFGKIYHIGGRSQKYLLADPANEKFRLAETMSKYVIRGDTLILLSKQNAALKPWCRLIPESAGK